MDLECEEPARNISLHLFAGSQQQVTGQARVISSLNENPSQVQGLVLLIVPSLSCIINPLLATGSFPLTFNI